eukprot:10757618-Alexandrium_andersonii.AAC.1
MEHVANAGDRAGGYAGLLERAGLYDDLPVVGPTPFRCCSPAVARKAVQAGEGTPQPAQPEPAAAQGSPAS